MIVETVLLVGTDPPQMLLARMLLQEAGYRVLEAGSAEEAVRAAGAEQPRAVLLDASLPLPAGLDLARSLRRDPRTSTTCIVLTAPAGAADAETAQSAGCDAFIEKPCPTRPVIAEVVRLLESAHGHAGTGVGGAML